MTIERVLALAEEGDRLAVTALEQAGTHLGRVLVRVVGALNPSLLVLGGHVGAYSPHFLRAATSALTAGLLGTTADALTVVHAALGDRSELLGAGARVLRDDDRVRAFIASV